MCSFVLEHNFGSSDDFEIAPKSHFSTQM